MPYPKEAFSSPSETKGVNTGDLVRVVYLPPSMRHFAVITGVVHNKKGKNFFIRGVDKKGRPIRGSEVGWYTPENVQVLVPAYLTTKEIYKPLPKGLFKE